MKALTDYPTPETDCAEVNIVTDAELLNHARRMEQRLAACRDALQSLDEPLRMMKFTEDGELRTTIRETLSLTSLNL